MELNGENVPGCNRQLPGLGIMATAATAPPYFNVSTLSGDLFFSSFDRIVQHWHWLRDLHTEQWFESH